jgi:Rrf2 family protein
MIKFSRKIEYGILALQYIALNPERVVSAKEISERLDIPFEFLSKTLQQLMKKELIISQQGLKGGYVLSRSAIDITMMDVITALEGNASIVECFIIKSGLSCDRLKNCSIRNPMTKIQSKVSQVFSTTTLEEVANS